MPPSLQGFAYERAALDYLRLIPQKKKIRKQIVKKIETLARNPLPPTSKLIQGMVDGEDRVHRIRSGDYRVLYVVRDEKIIVLDIDHRKDVYR